MSTQSRVARRVPVSVDVCYVAAVARQHATRTLSAGCRSGPRTLRKPDAKRLAAREDGDSKHGDRSGGHCNGKTIKRRPQSQVYVHAEISGVAQQAHVIGQMNASNGEPRVATWRRRRHSGIETSPIRPTQPQTSQCPRFRDESHVPDHIERNLGLRGVSMNETYIRWDMSTVGSDPSECRLVPYRMVKLPCK